VANHSSLSKNDSLVTTMTEETPDHTSVDDVPREIRSALLEYNDPNLHEAEDHVYSPLVTNKTRIRLLRLYAGAIENPTVICQILEAEFLQEQASPFIVDQDGSLTNVIIEYEALSWRWSDEIHSPHSIILIGSDGQKRKKRVSKTLGLAMKYLRREKDRILWIDAICINQSDMEERSSQVSMMSLIYSHAQQVCVWLGEDDHNSRKAIAFIREVFHNYAHGNFKFGYGPSHIPTWRAFLALVQREWFTRRWVVQEIVLAAQASVYCGPEELMWGDLTDAANAFESLTCRPHVNEEGLKTNWFESMSHLPVSVLLMLLQDKASAGDIKRQLNRPGLRSLEHLVTSLADFECGHPHDYVYSLIAMAKDAFPTRPRFFADSSHAAIVHRMCGTISEQAAYPVDYNCTLPDMCRTFVEFCVRTCAKRDPIQALDVLCRPWAKAWEPQHASRECKRRRSEAEKTALADDTTSEDIPVARLEPVKDVKGGKNGPTETYDQCVQPSRAYLLENKRQRRTEGAKLGLPSWVATVEKAPFRRASHIGILGVHATEMKRNNADLLVGSPGEKFPMYNAGHYRSLDLNSLRFRKREFLDHHSLYLKGFCFDRVASISQASRSGTIPRSWFALGDWPEAAAANTDLPNPPTAFWKTLVAGRDGNNRLAPYYFERACREVVVQSVGDGDAIDTTAPIYTGRFVSIIGPFCRRLLSVIWNRVMIKTKKGALGLVSKGVQEGDLICILYGCTVPVILRQENARFKTENEHNDELLEDGMEAMKRLVAQLRRYRERKLRYSEMSEQERAEIKKHTANYNKEHTVEKNTEESKKYNTEDEDLETERKLWFGKTDPQSDIDSEDDIPDIEEDDALQDKPEDKEQLTDEQKLKIEQDEAAQKRRKKDTAKETPKRHQERQYKAKIRDPLRYYRFLDQAYIHGLMDGEAVDHKLRSGRPDHVFEIR
jgi:hypothetical protein